MTGFQPYNPDAAPNDDTGFDPPPDGTYNGCTLRDAKAFTSKSGNDGVLLEWETPTGQRWAVWSGFKSEKQSAITWSDVAKLGVNPVDIGDLQQLNAALQPAIGGYYDLVVKTNGQFRNTYLNGASAGSNPVVQQQTANGQEQLAAAPASAVGGPVDDDDIPF